MNHERLWPNYESKTSVTDPELIEVFDNFAFDEVIGHVFKTRYNGGTDFIQI